MVLIILGVLCIIAAIILWVISIDECDDSVGVRVAAGILVIVAVACFVVVGKVNGPFTEQVKTVGLQSVRTESSIETRASFFLLVGSYSSEKVEELVFFTENSEGIRRRSLKEIPWDQIRFVEDDEVPPSFSVSYKVRESMNYFIDCVEEEDQLYIFTVPVGTVTSEYKVE